MQMGIHGISSEFAKVLVESHTDSVVTDSQCQNLRISDPRPFTANPEHIMIQLPQSLHKNQRHVLITKKAHQAALIKTRSALRMSRA